MPLDILSSKPYPSVIPEYLINDNAINDLGDNCIQNFHLGRYIVGYTVGNLVLRRRASGAVKRDFRTYIRRYTSPNENFEYGYPHSNALLQFDFKLERCKPHKAARHLTKDDVIDDVKLFPTVYRRIYCRKFLTLSNQTSRYKRKCIRIVCILSFNSVAKKVLYLMGKYVLRNILTATKKMRF